VDRASATQAVNATTGLEDRLKRVEAQARRTNAALDWRSAGESIGRVAATIGALGASITGPLVGAAALFVARAGEADSTSRQWLATTSRVEAAYGRVGRVVAIQILPALEQAANL